MERLYKVTFKYRDIAAQRDEHNVLTSHIIEKFKQFKSEDAIADFVSNNKTINFKGKIVTLLYYVVKKYVVVKEKEFSINVYGNKVEQQ